MGLCNLPCFEACHSQMGVTIASGLRLAGGCKELRGECLFITGFITWETKQNAKVVAISSDFLHALNWIAKMV